MPLYEYECARCGPFSDFRPMSDYALPAPCPSCNTEAPRALFSAPAMIAGGAVRSAAGPASPPSGLSPFGRHRGGCGCGCGGSARIRRADWVRKLL